MPAKMKIIGGGLAGCEAALQCARLGLRCELYEMRPAQSTPAHQTAELAELVCSNSLKSESEFTAPWLLKREMRLAGSALLECADHCAVPAGHALAVDRVAFAAMVTELIACKAFISVRREEVSRINETEGITIIASGPLTSPRLADEIARLAGCDPLYFYDSIGLHDGADGIVEIKMIAAGQTGDH